MLDHAVEELGAAVRELRELANGLRPSALVDGGLVAALDELAGRVPLAVEIDLRPVALDPVAEEALWFVACEAVANAVKHADAAKLRLALVHENHLVRLICADDGKGGADRGGGGLQGIADRIDAVGGSLRVDSAIGVGTIIEAVVPCAS